MGRLQIKGWGFLSFEFNVLLLHYYFYCGPIKMVDYYDDMDHGTSVHDPQLNDDDE